jgi:hypothetical protein
LFFPLGLAFESVSCDLKSCPQASATNMSAGSQVWVEDPEVAWVEAEVLDSDGKEVRAQTIKGNVVS